MLEEARERMYNKHARVIQKAFKKYFATKRQQQQKEESVNVVWGQKERRRGSVNRKFYGDYIGLELNCRIKNLIWRKEKILFAEIVQKFDRRFKVLAFWIIREFF